MRPAKRGTWVVAVLAVPAVCAALVFVSGACAFVERATHPTQWVPTFAESFDPKPLCAKYEQLLAPCQAKTDSTRNGLLAYVIKSKTLTFDGVASEEQATVVLTQLRADLVRLAGDARVGFHGEVQAGAEAGTRHWFELHYSHRGADGTIRGKATPVTLTTWRVECEVTERR